MFHEPGWNLGRWTRKVYDILPRTMLYPSAWEAAEKIWLVVLRPEYIWYRHRYPLLSRNKNRLRFFPLPGSRFRCKRLRDFEKGLFRQSRIYLGGRYLLGIASRYTLDDFRCHPPLCSQVQPRYPHAANSYGRFYGLAEIKMRIPAIMRTFDVLSAQHRQLHELATASVMLFGRVIAASQTRGSSAAAIFRG